MQIGFSDEAYAGLRNEFFFEEYFTKGKVLRQTMDPHNEVDTVEDFQNSGFDHPINSKLNPSKLTYR